MPPNLTNDQLRQIAANAGFQGSAIDTAAAVALAESSGNPNAVGDLNLTPGGSIGLWQINLAAHPQYSAQQLKDAQANAAAAYAVYKAAGYKFTPWTTYRTGAYAKYLPDGSIPYTAQGQTASVTSGFTPVSYSPSAGSVKNGYVYGYAGPPFNFLGHFCVTQWQTFQNWVNAHATNLPAVQQHFQIRAAQLRKTAGVLEEFYSTLNDEYLTPTFNKEPWKPGPQGHFHYPYRDDQLPMIAMQQIKDYMKEQFQRQDESVFAMNHVRNLIEKNEDKAEKAHLALNPTQFSDETIQTLITRINGYFQSPEYEAVLVDDQNDVYPTGTSQPRFRVHQLDIPTQWEIEQTTSAPAGSGKTVDTREVGT